MVVDGEVVPGQRLERLPAAESHVDVHVHAPRPQQRRVEAVLVVGGEDDDPLLAAGRPQPVDEVEKPGQRYVLLLLLWSREAGGGGFARRGGVVVVGITGVGRHRHLLSRVPGRLGVEAAIDVLDDEDGPVRHADEQPQQRGVARAGEVEVVEVVPEVVGHGGHEAGLAGAGRAVEQVPALPRLADPPVVVPPVGEEVEVGDDGPLERRVHSERVERGRVVMLQPVPGAPLVHADLERPLPLPRLLGRRHHEGHVPLHGHVRVLRVEAEVQHELAVPVLDNLLLSSFAALVGVDGRPRELDAVEHVDGGVPGLDEQAPPPAARAIVQGRLAERDPEAAHGAQVEPGGEVRPRGVQEEILLAAAAAGPGALAPDDERAPLLAAPAEPRADHGRAPGRRGAHLVREELPRHAPGQHRVRRR
ncbi:hypothetical protein BRADI_1g26155v3 [Brachypodium distachyon]|uniref:Uncharacterized protein n=1 Tax=Brachypodium distachyon TaxID=15368 RepID=A0A0Q3NF53_BRADI|nr:hypothetical protein BRADI_1g26155v3 [Brachypodium distachyon]